MARASKFEQVKLEVLQAIELRSRGKSPAVRDLAAEADVGVATMHSYLTRLSEEGLVTWKQGKHRSLRLTQEGSQALASSAK